MKNGPGNFLCCRPLPWVLTVTNAFDRTLHAWARVIRWLAHIELRAVPA